MLGLSELLSDLGIDVVLRASLRCHVQVLTLIRVAILLALPHERLFLGGDFEDRRVKRLDNRVRKGSLLVDNLLTVGGHLVVETV